MQLIQITNHWKLTLKSMFTYKQIKKVAKANIFQRSKKSWIPSTKMQSPSNFLFYPLKKNPTLLSITLTTLTNAFQQILKINLLFPHTSNEIKFVLFWRKKKAFNFNRILQKGHQFSLFLISSIHIPQNKRKCTTFWGKKKIPTFWLVWDQRSITQLTYQDP